MEDVVNVAAFGSALGKRAFDAVDGEAMEWTPGDCQAGDPCDAANASASKAQRTSLLFAELQTEMREEREAVRLAKRAHSFRELRISAELAARFPMRVTDDEDEDKELFTLSVARGSHTQTEVETAADSSTQAAENVGEEMCSEKAAARRRHAGPVLPSPLTFKGLEAAYAELPAGARNTIISCMQCWQNGRLDNVDTVETVRSFAGQSPAIRALFHSAGTAQLPHLCGGEAASDEDMLDLIRMAMQA